MAEDADFAKRLKQWGKKHGKNTERLKMEWLLRADDLTIMETGCY